jgi:enoyl-CoA hydratase/carnithine racemase
MLDGDADGRSPRLNAHKRTWKDTVVFDTLKMQQERAALFVEITAPPMNLLGLELVRDLVSLIQTAEADDSVQVLVFKSADPDYFISHVDVMSIRTPLSTSIFRTAPAPL